MQKLLTMLTIPGFLLGLGIAPALAHDEHCHTKDAQGTLTDAPDAKTKKACEAAAGTWFHHHQHCHKADAGGKMIDIKDAKDQKGCEAKGGRWTDHGHDQKPGPATTK